MKRDFDDKAERHVAGATATHAGPYAVLEVPHLKRTLSREFIDKWVVPFYRKCHVGDVTEIASAMRPIAADITNDVLVALLSEFNWRPRITAAYFAAILRETSLEDHVGKLLLRSDVCFAGRGYCLALARFNTPNSVAYLTRYLDHYLAHPDLYFEQGDALAAIAYIDGVNGTDRLTQFTERWDAFCAGKGDGWRLDRMMKRFDEQMAAIGRAAEDLISGR